MFGQIYFQQFYSHQNIKMKNYLVLLLSVFALFNLRAQDKPSVDKNQLKIILPGLVYEHDLSILNVSLGWVIGK